MIRATVGILVGFVLGWAARPISERMRAIFERIRAARKPKRKRDNKGRFIHVAKFRKAILPVIK